MPSDRKFLRYFSLLFLILFFFPPGRINVCDVMKFCLLPTIHLSGEQPNRLIFFLPSLFFGFHNHHFFKLLSDWAMLTGLLHKKKVVRKKKKKWLGNEMTAVTFSISAVFSSAIIFYIMTWIPLTFCASFPFAM